MGLYKRNNIFWFSFMHHGRRIQESTGVENRKAAAEIESARRIALAKGEVGLVTQPHRSVGQLLDALKERWAMEGKASSQNLSILKVTRTAFGQRMSEELTSSMLTSYAVRRQKQGAANATVNRVFQCLARAYTLAGLEPPSMELLREDNRRTGFIEAQQMAGVLAALPDDGLRDFVQFCYSTGMRKGEARNLRWSFIDNGQIVVPAEFCKSRRPHTISIAGPLVAIFKRRMQARAYGNTLCEFVFHRGGRPIVDFKKSWRTACARAGCGNLLFHDLRRCAVRDMVRSGVPQSVAMKITGHETDSIFKRYDIVTTDDMSQALERTEKYRAG